MAEDIQPDDDFVEEVTREEVALKPGDAADPDWLIQRAIPEDIRAKYEIHSYRSAATILAESHPREFQELCDALRDFKITTSMIRTAGGSESDIPKLISAHFDQRIGARRSSEATFTLNLSRRNPSS